DQMKRAAMRPHRGQREIVADASAAEDLDSAVDDIGEHGRRDDLNHRDFFLGSFFAQRIDHPSRFEGQEAGLFDLQFRLGDPVLNDALLCWRYLSGLLGSVLPIAMNILQRSRAAPEIHHLRPLRTYSSPSRLMENWMLVASELATSGSVIANAERIWPLSRGSSHVFFCSSVPNCARISILPVSGAAQLNTSEAQATLPMISARGAYSRFVSPAPYSSSGRKRFQSPSARALTFNSSTISAW